MQIFENFVKCKNYYNNINNKCYLFTGKNVDEEDAGCYIGIDKVNQQKLVGGLKK